MRNNDKRVIVFDLDETLGCFVELGAFCGIIEKYNRRKLTFEEFYNIMDIFPEFLRPNILSILRYLKDKKQKGDLYKVFIYTNNQGPKQWAENIRLYLERKIDYKLFDKVIGAYKVNGKIVEHTRSTHDKTITDFVRSTNLPNNTQICFVDDLYHAKMDNGHVYYINIMPYTVSLSPRIMAERYYKHNSNLINNKHVFINHIIRQMNRYNIDIVSKSYLDNKQDSNISKQLFVNLRNFLRKMKNKTKKVKSNKPNRTNKIKTTKTNY